MTQKVCADCKAEKTLDCFTRLTQSKDGLNPRCRPCIAIRNHSWYERNKELTRELDAAWRARNTEREKELKRARWKRWNERNSEAMKAANRERMRAPERRIARQIWGALRGMKCGIRWTEILGYGEQELRSHLERQFLKGMSWDNYGQWHVDHIVPLAEFTISGRDDPELRRAWALTNLRPLWAKDNQSKSCRRLHLI